MCTFSMIGDDFSQRIQKDEFWKRFVKPVLTPSPQLPISDPSTQSRPSENFVVNLNFATKQELEMLRREVEQLRDLLKRAIKYDEANNEPHCEVESKIQAIKIIAEALGVDLTEVLKSQTI